MSSFLITFFSTHGVLKAEKILKQEGIPCDLIPTPRRISSECGFSILLKNSLSRQTLEEKLRAWEHLYRLSIDKEGRKEYEKIS